MQTKLRNLVVGTVLCFLVVMFASTTERAWAGVGQRCSITYQAIISSGTCRQMTLADCDQGTCIFRQSPKSSTCVNASQCYYCTLQDPKTDSPIDTPVQQATSSCADRDTFKCSCGTPGIFVDIPGSTVPLYGCTGGKFMSCID